MADHEPKSLADRLPEVLRGMADADRSKMTPILARAVEVQMWLDAIAGAVFVDPHDVPEIADSMGKIEDEYSPTGTSEIYRVSDANETGKDRFVKVPCKE